MKYLRKFNDENEYNKARTDEFIKPWVSLTRNCEDKCDIVSIIISGCSSGDTEDEETYTIHDFDGEYFYFGDYEEYNITYKQFSGSTSNIIFRYGDVMILPDVADIHRKTVCSSDWDNYPYCGLVAKVNYGTSETNRIDYNTEGDCEYKPLTFDITSDGYINYVWTYGHQATIYYSINGGEWTDITPTYVNGSTLGTTIPVVSGDTVQFIGNDGTMCGDYWCRGSRFSFSTCGFKVSGNLLSLIYENYLEYDVPCNSVYFPFPNLFECCTGLTDASKLVIPNFIGDGMYTNMFSGCTNLAAAPVIPEIHAGNQDWSTLTDMFYGCSSLNYFKCLCTFDGNTDPMSGMLSGTAPNGTLVVYGCGLDWIRRDDSVVPRTWTILDKDGNDITSCYPEL